MIFLVNDANILIDLLKIGLLDAFFHLEYDFQVTDMVVAEVQEDNVTDLLPYLEGGALTRQGFSFDELLQIQQLQGSNPNLSVPDCSCLFLSSKVTATLLTGDAALRRAAEQNGIAVHGILWIFDELVSAGLISAGEAHEKLSQLMELNPRLPVKECKRRLKSWGN